MLSRLSLVSVETDELPPATADDAPDEKVDDTAGADVENFN
jgi:hypothetical protein